MSPLGPQAIDGLILDSALQANMLPLGSQCDSRCVFCSHKNNPPGIAVAFAGRRTMEEVTRTMAFLDPERVITIGESATAIVEGEPFLHPDFTEIVSLVRRVFPATPIEITTNGRLLDEEMVALLEATGGVGSERVAEQRVGSWQEPAHGRFSRAVETGPRGPRATRAIVGAIQRESRGHAEPRRVGRYA